VAGDINGDGLPDVIVANKKGAFVHLQVKKTVTKEEWEQAQPRALPAPGGTAALPSAVDLKANFERWQLLQRKQGARNTCSVFATAGAMEFAVARKLNRGIPLSVEFLNWAGDQVINRAQDGHFFSSVIQGYEKYGICPEGDMPYADKFRAEYQPSEQARAAALALHEVDLQFHWLRPNDGTQGLTDGHIRGIKEVLAKGWPVAAGSYHSILFIGYRDDAALEGGGEFFVRDSGGGNERTLSYTAAKVRMCDLFWVETSGGAAGRE
jgi:hypothetical protein